MTRQEIERLQQLVALQAAKLEIQAAKLEIKSAKIEFLTDRIVELEQTNQPTTGQDQ